MHLTVVKRPSVIHIKSEHLISDVTNTPPERLFYIADNIKNYYTSFQIPKRDSGVRIITPPNKELKMIQRSIKCDIETRIKLHNYLHGGVPGKSTLTNAKQHVRKKMVANIDIKDFFPSVGFEKVFNVLKNVGYDDETSWLFTKLTTLNNGLPQGSPTSMLLANLALLPADERFFLFCKRRNLSYTRYVDDITVSGDTDLRSLKGLFSQFIMEAGFEVAIDKIKFLGRNERQVVTGLVVNDRIRPTPEYISRLKKDIRMAWPEALGVEMAASILGFSVNEFYRNLWGRINFLKSIDTKLGQKIRGLLVKVG